jgi:hypothetical protein
MFTINLKAAVRGMKLERLCAAGLALVMLTTGAFAAPPRRQPPPLTQKHRPSVVVRPAVISPPRQNVPVTDRVHANFSATVLGVQAHWDFNAGGYVVDAVDPNGLAANLPNGASLDPGDVIVQVGTIQAQPNLQLQFLVDAAVNTGNRFIVVTDVNSGSNFTEPF